LTTLALGRTIIGLHGHATNEGLPHRSVQARRGHLGEPDHLQPIPFVEVRAEGQAILIGDFAYEDGREGISSGPLVAATNRRGCTYRVPTNPQLALKYLQLLDFMPEGRSRTVMGARPYHVFRRKAVAR
jgi:hypothetical protein